MGRKTSRTYTVEVFSLQFDPDFLQGLPYEAQCAVFDKHSELFMRKAVEDPQSLGFSHADYDFAPGGDHSEVLIIPNREVVRVKERASHVYGNFVYKAAIELVLTGPAEEVEAVFKAMIDFFAVTDMREVLRQIRLVFRLSGDDIPLSQNFKAFIQAEGMTFTPLSTPPTSDHRERTRDGSHRAETHATKRRL
jgi:hypothetical protein